MIKGVDTFFSFADSFAGDEEPNGEYTFETVLGASRTLADLTIIDVIDNA
jgi:hypothetical protein